MLQSYKKMLLVIFKCFISFYIKISKQQLYGIIKFSKYSKNFGRKKIQIWLKSNFLAFFDII